MSKKINVTLIPRYKGKHAIEYERIRSTICKTRLYKFIGVPYSQPLTKLHLTFTLIFMTNAIL